LFPAVDAIEARPGVMTMRAAKVRALDGRWRSWAPAWLASHRPSRLALPHGTGTARAALPADQRISPEDLKKRIGTAALAFRGYDTSNLGRAAEFLEHDGYGPIVRSLLDSASVLCADVLHRRVDLTARALAREPSTLDTFVQDIGTVVALELAQVKILEQFFDVPVRDARLSFGHSICELSALVLGGMYEMEQLLKVPLSLAPDCAALTANTTMGILSVQGHTLQVDAVQHLCATISRRGHGLIGPSTYLSPYQVLVLGQRDTLDLLEAEMHGFLPANVTLRRKPNQWPPLHTPLVWECNIPNRTAMMMHQIEGGDRKPRPIVISCTTGVANYDEWNSRAILADWTDHPQRIWDVMENTLASGVELVIHVGPEPKLIPTCFDRLGHRIMKQLRTRHLERLGSSVIPSIGRNRWLARKLPANAVLLRAPFVNHIILEDWLLSQHVG
jgi:[acyl-carrier-protein] S-malonyltransferase